MLPNSLSIWVRYLGLDNQISIHSSCMIQGTISTLSFRRPNDKKWLTFYNVFWHHEKKMYFLLTFSVQPCLLKIFISDMSVQFQSDCAVFFCSDFTVHTLTQVMLSPLKSMSPKLLEILWTLHALGWVHYTCTLLMMRRGIDRLWDKSRLCTFAGLWVDWGRMQSYKSSTGLKVVPSHT